MSVITYIKHDHWSHKQLRRPFVFLLFIVIIWGILHFMRVWTKVYLINLIKVSPLKCTSVWEQSFPEQALHKVLIILLQGKMDIFEGEIINRTFCETVIEPQGCNFTCSNEIVSEVYISGCRPVSVDTFCEQTALAILSMLTIVWSD